MNTYDLLQYTARRCCCCCDTNVVDDGEVISSTVAREIQNISHINLFKSGNIADIVEVGHINRVPLDSFLIDGKAVDIFGNLSDEQIQEALKNDPEKILKDILDAIKKDKEVTIREIIDILNGKLNPADAPSRLRIVNSGSGSNGSGSGTGSGTGTGGTDEPGGTGSGTGTGGTDEPGGTGSGTGTGGTDEPGGTGSGTGTGGTDEPGGTGSGTGTGGTGEPGGTGESGDDTGDDTPKKSFISEFSDVDTMFEYLSDLSGGKVNKNTGITRAQLVHLTQNEVWEDSNYSFWGTLNRIFDKLDTNKDSDSSYANDVLSYDELKAFIGEELGDSVTAYMSKVNQYAQQIQSAYSSMTAQQKLNFVLERTKEYFESAGLTYQLNALNRLTSETDTQNSGAVAKKGQIVMTTFTDRGDGYVTLGAYASAGFPYIYNDPNDSAHPFTGTYYGFDYDEAGVDRGITLNKILLDEEWYKLVDTLVHEITHATASQYYADPACQKADGGYYTYFDVKSVEILNNLGLFTTDEYNFYKNNFDAITDYQTMTIPSGAHAGENAFDRLMYLLECQWGEYAAYQADADYVDSIAGDYFDAGHITTAVSGANEKGTITSHIADAYDNTSVGYNENLINGYSREAKPDYEWATYAKNKNWTWNA